MVSSKAAAQKKSCLQGRLQVRVSSKPEHAGIAHYIQTYRQSMGYHLKCLTPGGHKQNRTLSQTRMSKRAQDLHSLQKTLQTYRDRANGRAHDCDCVRVQHYR